MESSYFTRPAPVHCDENASENWTKFKLEFNSYLSEFDLTDKDDSFKIEKLLNLIGEEAFKIYLNFNKELTNENYNNIIERFDEYFNLKRDEASHRYNFFTRKQNDRETFDYFLKDLQNLAYSCNFGELLDSLIRDAIVLGTRESRVRELLLKTPDLNLKAAVNLCKMVESSIIKSIDEDLDKFNNQSESSNKGYDFKVEIDGKNTLDNETMNTLDGELNLKRELDIKQEIESDIESDGLETSFNQKDIESDMVSADMKNDYIQSDIKLEDELANDEPKPKKPKLSTGVNEESRQAIKIKEEPDSQQITQSTRAIAFDDQVKSVEEMPEEGSSLNELKLHRSSLKFNEDFNVPNTSRVNSNLENSQFSFNNYGKELVISSLKSKPYSCIYCEFNADEIYIIDKHVKAIHHDIAQHFCTFCDYKTKQKSHLKKHINAVHNKLKPFSCSDCDYKAAENYLLRRHIKSVHQNKKLSCTHCDYTTKNEDHFKKHNDIVHSGIKPFQCDICDYKAFNNSRLMCHINAVHNRIKPFTCDHCDYCATDRKRLNEHIDAIHKGLRPYACKYCQYSASLSSTLKNHVRKIHHVMNDDSSSDKNKT